MFQGKAEEANEVLCLTIPWERDHRHRPLRSGRSRRRRIRQEPAISIGGPKRLVTDSVVAHALLLHQRSFLRRCDPRKRFGGFRGTCEGGAEFMPLGSMDSAANSPG